MLTTHKNKLKLSLLATSLLMAYSANTLSQEQSEISDSSVKSEENLDVITVYGRHNRLILESGTATKSNMSLLETPAAVVVVDGTLLQEQGLTTLQDALRNISGLTQDGNNYGIGDNLAIRGLGVNYTLDGIYAGGDLGNTYNPTRSLTNIESIEVLKGPATGLYGMGEAGGVINLIEKKPQDEAFYSVRMKGGSWDSFGIMADATSAINDTVAYRVVVNHESSSGYRSLGDERSELYTSLRFKLSNTNQILLSGAYIDDAVQIDSVGDPVRLIDFDALGLDYGDTITAADLVNGDGLQLTDDQILELVDSLRATDGYRPYKLGGQGLISPISTPNQGEEVRFKIRQDIDFDSTLSFTHQLQYRTYESDYVRQTGGYNYVYYDRNGTINLEPRAPLVEDGVLYPFAARRQEYRKITADETAIQYFADLTKTWSMGGVEGEHLVSANYETRDIKYQQLSIWDADDGRSAAVPYIYDIRNPNWGTGKFEDYITDYSEDGSLRSKYDKSVAAWGVSFQEVLYFNDALTGRFGGAYGAVKQTYQNQRTSGNPEYDADDSGFTYNLGLSYKLTDTIATFINHSKGRTAYSVLGSLSAEDNRPDSESVSWDLGVRFTALSEQIIGSVVWFDTARTNLRYTNPDYDETENPDVTQYYYDEADRTEGVELDVNFDINEQWALNFNATYQDPVTEPGDFAASQALEQTKGIAEKLSSLWLSYRHRIGSLPEPINFSLGVRYEDERSINSTSFNVDRAFLPSYTRWDAAIGYNSDNWIVQLNLNNLTNKYYYTTAMFLGGLPGEERNAQLTVTYNF